MSSKAAITPTEEDDVKRKISEWITCCNRKVYWEEDNNYNKDSLPYFTFNVKGAKRKPDLIVSSGDRLTAIEVKVGYDKGAIYDGIFQLKEYWKSYVDGEVTYYINEKDEDDQLVTIKKPISDFVLATLHSRDGHLFDDNLHHESPLDINEFGEGRKDAINKGSLPGIEYNMTELATRALWRSAGLKPYSGKRKDKKRRDDERKSSSSVGIGVLLSSILDDGNNAPKPMILVNRGGEQFWQSL